VLKSQLTCDIPKQRAVYDGALVADDPILVVAAILVVEVEGLHLLGIATSATAQHEGGLQVWLWRKAAGSGLKLGCRSLQAASHHRCNATTFRPDNRAQVYPRSSCQHS
jgi:hypothetical protein